MLNELEQKILDAYEDGSDLGYIIECLNTTHSRVKEVLLAFKEANRTKKTYSNELKKVIAERDKNGIARRQIALELEINVNTVKKACEAFGQSYKDRASSENEFTRIDLEEFDMTVCPTCKSKKVNKVDDNTIYCMKCGSEHEFFEIFEDAEDDDGNKIKIFKEAYAMKLNWEYLEDK